MGEKVALITGASRGIGKACAIALAEEGYKVAVHYNSGKEAATELCEKIGNALPIQANLASEDDCKQLIKNVKQEFGRLDVLVNNAGINID